MAVSASGSPTSSGVSISASFESTPFGFITSVSAGSSVASGEDSLTDSGSMGGISDMVSGLRASIDQSGRLVGLVQGGGVGGRGYGWHLVGQHLDRLALQIPHQTVPELATLLGLH